MIFIEIDPDLTASVRPETLERAAQAVLRHQSAEGALTIVLTSDERLHELNREFLDTDAPTDVLSFPAGEESDPETGAAYLGDVIISAARAGQQARAAGHPLDAELQLLVAHGVLHLLGHDHAEAREKERMWAAQAEILAGLGLAGMKVPE